MNRQHIYHGTALPVGHMREVFGPRISDRSKMVPDREMNRRIKLLGQREREKHECATSPR